MTNEYLVLASTSPRRRELLGCLGIEFQVKPANVLEIMNDQEDPRDMVVRLALSKARKVARSLSGGTVIGGDSAVVTDGQVLGKPEDATEATWMLKCLRGKEHQVMTGVAVVSAAGGRELTSSQTSAVTMRVYTDAEIEAYVSSGEPMDKAGAYAVQDKAFRPAVQVEGCYANVMGLPLCLLVDLLKEAGYEFRPGHKFQVPGECSQCPLKMGT